MSKKVIDSATWKTIISVIGHLCSIENPYLAVQNKTVVRAHFLNRPRERKDFAAYSKSKVVEQHQFSKKKKYAKNGMRMPLVCLFVILTLLHQKTH